MLGHSIGRGKSISSYSWASAQCSQELDTRSNLSWRPWTTTGAFCWIVTSPCPTNSTLSSRFRDGTNYEIKSTSSQEQSSAGNPIHSTNTCLIHFPHCLICWYATILDGMMMGCTFVAKRGKVGLVISSCSPWNGLRSAIWNVGKIKLSSGNWSWYTTELNFLMMQNVP